MNIRRVVPQPPPTFTMEFTVDEGWGLLAAIRQYVDTHPHAHHADDWRKWAKDLDRELRR